MFWLDLIGKIAIFNLLCTLSFYIIYASIPHVLYDRTRKLILITIIVVVYGAGVMTGHIHIYTSFDSK